MTSRVPITPIKNTTDHSPNIHLLSHSTLIPPPRPDPPHKLIQNPRPRPILTPPPHPPILQTLPCKSPRLIPHILTNTLLPPLLQVLNPPSQPRCAIGSPGEGRAGEEQAPVFDCCVEGEDFLAGEAGDEEGLFVDFFEEGGLCGEGVAEGGYLGLLFA